MRHFIPCTEGSGARDVARIYLENVWKLHGLQETVVSDRCTQFTSDFWKSLCECLEISPRFSTAFHPQTERQTEKVNAIIEQYFHSYVNHQQDDWARYLLMAEFATNNHVSELRKLSPFKANYRRHPRMMFRLLWHGTTINEDQANTMARDISEVFGFLKAEMFRAQRIQDESANAYRVLAPPYAIEDKVWLSTWNLLTKRPSKKLDWKQVGPYPIFQIVSPYIYKLHLPPTMKVYPVFYVSLLSHAADPRPGQKQLLPPPVEIEGNQKWEFDVILDSRKRPGKLEYLVRYTGYDEPLWQSFNDLENSPEFVENFHDQYPHKPQGTYVLGGDLISIMA